MPSGWLPNVQPQQPIASSWGNSIRDRTLTLFDTIAQRDAQLPTPARGMSCYVLATAELLIFDGTAWRKPWNMPWGLLAPVAINTANSGDFTSAAGNQDAAGLAITFTVPANRIVRLRTNLRFSNASANQNLTYRMLIGETSPANADRAFHDVLVYDSAQAYGSILEYFLPTGYAAGTFSFKSRWSMRSGGGTTGHLSGAATAPNYLVAEDLGPVAGTIPA